MTTNFVVGRCKGRPLSVLDITDIRFASKIAISASSSSVLYAVRYCPCDYLGEGVACIVDTEFAEIRFCEAQSFNTQELDCVFQKIYFLKCSCVCRCIAGLYLE